MAAVFGGEISDDGCVVVVDLFLLAAAAAAEAALAFAMEEGPDNWGVGFAVFEFDAPAPATDSMGRSPPNKKILSCLVLD